MLDMVTEKWTKERVEILRDDARRWRSKADALPPGLEKADCQLEATKADRLADQIALWLEQEKARRARKGKDGPSTPPPPDRP
jgi:hypothetical protein